MPTPTDTLVHFLEAFPTPLPNLWVGAGASAAAGYPTLSQLDAHLRSRLPAATPAAGYALVDEYVAEYGAGALKNELETLIGHQRPPAGLHVSLARLAGANRFAAILTTNYDELIEDALKGRGVQYVPQVLEKNFDLQARLELSVLKLHGDRGDWSRVILSGDSYRHFHATYPLLNNQFDLNLRVHPFLFVGCSMQDPRLLGWLRALRDPERRALFPGRALITAGDWSSIPATDQALLASANIKPIAVPTHGDIGVVLQEVADHLAP